MFMQRCLFTESPRCLIRAVCVIGFSVCGASTASAEMIAPRPYHAVWPTGWEVSYLPAPKTDSGEDLGGERVRVMLKSDDGFAAIELTYFPHSDKGQANLTKEFARVRSRLRTIFEQQKLSVTMTPAEAQPSALGGQSALTLELSASNDRVHVKQWVGMALSTKFLYSLTFTAYEKNYARYRPQFDAVKQSITLQ